MRAFLIVASCVMLVSAEPPTSYSHSSSGSSGNLRFQPVPSVAQLHSTSGGQGGGASQGYTAPSQSYGSPAQSQAPSYNAPTAPQSSYGAPQQQPQQSYGAPSSSRGQSQSQGYSAPQPQQQYSAQQSFQQNQYAAPAPQYHAQSQPANVQVSYGAPPQLPPGASYGPPPVVTGAGPDHEIEYRVVYKPVKAPKPDLVLPPPPPKQKTIVYILVPRIEAPEPIIVPTHAPTPPSKPEVYFIRYKAAKKSNKQGGGGGGYNSVPSGQYGAPSAPKPVVVDAPKKREVERRVTVTQSSSSEVNDAAEVSDASFGDRVNSRPSSNEE